MTQLCTWAKRLFSSKEDLFFLGSFIPQMWMYAALQHFDRFHFVSMMSFYLGLGGCLITAAILWYVKPKTTIPPGLSWVAGVALCAASISWILPFDFGKPIMIIIGVISGMGVGWCFLQWFYLYSKLNLKDATGYMLLSFSLVAVVTYLLTALATILNVSPLLLMAPLPIIAIPLCERSFTRLALDTTQEHRDKTAISHEQLRLRQIIPIAIELAVYALVLGLLRSQGAQTNDFGTSVQLNLLLRTVFPLILVLWIGVWLKPKGLINVAQAILIIIIIALLALALLGDAGTEVAAALVSLARNIVLVLLSVMLLYLAQTSPYHPFTVYGTGRFIHTLSTQIGFFLMTISVNNETIGVSLNVFFFITACLFVFLANRSLKTVQLFSQDNSNSALYQSNNKVVDKRCDEIRDDFGLTDREVEVMKLLAKGRSRGYIAETLVISENTVRWHAKGLYTKLNIHSKQELLTLIELT